MPPGDCQAQTICVELLWLVALGCKELAAMPFKRSKTRRQLICSSKA